jgi:hypothetical protein
MGSDWSNPITEALEVEKLRWAQSHRLGNDIVLQRQQVLLIVQFGSTLRMASRACIIAGIQYFHFLITDGIWVIEFGVGELADASVMVHSRHRTTSKTHSRTAPKYKPV